MNQFKIKLGNHNFKESSGFLVLFAPYYLDFPNMGGWRGGARVAIAPHGSPLIWLVNAHILVSALILATLCIYIFRPTPRMEHHPLINNS